MRESIGSIALYNIIIIFIVITFAILAGTMSYSKAFKANNRIINAIEKYEGYNTLSATWIDNFLSSIGYQVEPGTKCPVRQGVKPMEKVTGTQNANYRFCVYVQDEETKSYNGHYVTYGVVTYIYFDVPILGQMLRIPVYGRSNRVFCFWQECSEYIDALKDVVTE